MSSTQSDSDQTATWLVGAAFGGKDHQTPRFLEHGIRGANNPDARVGQHVRSMCRGDRITIKSTYIRWKNLPVGNHGASVSVMAIKATGTITENLNDGKTVKVDWVQQSPTKSEWYFHTWLVTVSKIQPGDWKADALVPFSFAATNNLSKGFSRPLHGEKNTGGAHQSDRTASTAFWMMAAFWRETRFRASWTAWSRRKIWPCKALLARARHG